MLNSINLLLSASCFWLQRRALLAYKNNVQPSVQHQKRRVAAIFTIFKNSLIRVLAYYIYITLKRRAVILFNSVRVIIMSITSCGEFKLRVQKRKLCCIFYNIILTRGLKNYNKSFVFIQIISRCLFLFFGLIEKWDVNTVVSQKRNSRIILLSISNPFKI